MFESCYFNLKAKTKIILVIGEDYSLLCSTNSVIFVDCQFFCFKLARQNLSVSKPEPFDKHTINFMSVQLPFYL